MSSAAEMLIFLSLAFFLPVDGLLMMRKGSPDPMFHFWFFYLPGIVLLVKQYGSPQSIIFKTCVPILECPSFLSPVLKKINEEFHFKLHLSPNCVQNEGCRSFPLRALGF